jgi:PAS domain-containing protein
METDARGAVVGEPYFRILFDAIPSPVLVVDGDVRVQDANAAGEAFLGRRPEILDRRGGDVLSCIHAVGSPSGCGGAAECRGCVVRNSVGEALAGQEVRRSRARLSLSAPGGVRDLWLLVTAAPISLRGERRVLLILEDQSELVRLKSLLPMCSWCKRVRDDRDYWTHVEDYLKEAADVDVSHSICEECMAKLFREEGVPPRG